MQRLVTRVPVEDQRATDHIKLAEAPPEFPWLAILIIGGILVAIGIAVKGK